MKALYDPVLPLIKTVHHRHELLLSDEGGLRRSMVLTGGSRSFQSSSSTGSMRPQKGHRSASLVPIVLPNVYKVNHWARQICTHNAHLQSRSKENMIENVKTDKTKTK